MAITVVQAPGGILVGAGQGYSLHSPLWHVMTSTNVAQPDFRFILDILVGAETVRLKISPDENNKGIVDLSYIIRSYIENYFTPVTGLEPFLITTGAVVIGYQVGYGEEYGGTEYPSLTTDLYYAYNAYHHDMPGVEGLTPVTPYIHQWATNRDIDDVRMPRNGKLLVSYINDPLEDHTIQIRQLDAEGVPFGTTYTSDNYAVSSYQLLVLNLNLENINAGDWGATPNPLPTNAEGYQISIVRDDGLDQTPWLKVRWLCEPKGPSTPLHFLNRLGGFDTYHFTGPTRKEVDLDRKTFQKIGAVMSGGIIREYTPGAGNVFADTVVPYYTQHKWSRKLVSGFVDDTTHEWLWELVASPQVYMEENGVYYPVVIKTQKWSEQLTRYDKMYNLEIEIEMGRRVFSQSR